MGPATTHRPAPHHAAPHDDDRGKHLLLAPLSSEQSTEGEVDHCFATTWLSIRPGEPSATTPMRSPTTATSSVASPEATTSTEHSAGLRTLPTRPSKREWAPAKARTRLGPLAAATRPPTRVRHGGGPRPREHQGSGARVGPGYRRTRPWVKRNRKRSPSPQGQVSMSPCSAHISPPSVSGSTEQCVAVFAKDASLSAATKVRLPPAKSIHG